ncbi:MAG TPA: hypothetical protein VES40_17470 [Ilumatobacteraceae bacterium]|nr:hypothetical protein [Ilumatobacteraceae bacterium]
MVRREDHLIDGQARSGLDRRAMLGEREPGVSCADDDDVEIVGRWARARR